MVTKRDFSMMSAEAGNLSQARITVESSDGGRGDFVGGGVHACMHKPCTNLHECITHGEQCMGGSGRGQGWSGRGGGSRAEQDGCRGADFRPSAVSDCNCAARAQPN